MGEKAMSGYSDYEKLLRGCLFDTYCCNLAGAAENCCIGE